MIITRNWIFLKIERCFAKWYICTDAGPKGNVSVTTYKTPIPTGRKSIDRTAFSSLLILFVSPVASVSRCNTVPTVCFYVLLQIS